MNEKLQKVLARTGLGSRREMERWITAGRVLVNQQVATLGMRVTERDHIVVDNKPIPFPKPTAAQARLLIYHKPVGEICSRHDPEGRPTVFEHLPRLSSGRWIAVGRLDYHSSGVLLFTNDGELANRLMHPSANIDREYAVRVYGAVNDSMIKHLQQGVALEDGTAKFNRIKRVGGSGKNQWYRVVVGEGRNRLVRRLWESQGVTVSRLIRIRFGQLKLPKDLSPGASREINSRSIIRSDSAVFH